MTQADDLLKRLLATGSGEDMYSLAEVLFPICRSITGDGVRATLKQVASQIPLDIHEVPSGTAVFDWTVPKEWNIRDAWIRDPNGKKVVDFQAHNLHVVSYSGPIHETLSLESLKPHLHSLPNQPDLIPYRTNYYSENWGFCLAHRVLEELEDGEYEVCIDSTLEEGSLTYGECLVRGQTDDEVLLSAHVCHPSLANDNLSGIALLTRLGEALKTAKTRYSYRLIFAPGTIGSITWLARNQAKTKKIRHGLVVSCVGDSGGPMYKKSRIGDATIDRAMCQVMADIAPEASIEAFSPYGYDERQYCSPGFNLPVGLFERSKYGAFPEYHTSADNLEFISAAELDRSYEMVCHAIDILESDCLPVNTMPHCEPQLGKRGLYEAMGGDNQRVERQMAMLWVLNLADGEHSLLDMAARSGVPYALIRETVAILRSEGLLSD